MAGGHGDRPIAVYGAIAANFTIAVAKFTAAFFTGSSAMISEGIHSVVDTGNQTLILVGLRQARQPAGPRHPFGRGKELYFWALIVAMILFGLGGGLSLYEGINHLQHPVASQNPKWNYVVLAISFVVEGIAWTIAARQFAREMGEEEGVFAALRASKDPSLFVIIMEDTAAMLGLVFAFLGVLLSQVTGNAIYEGIASILIGVTLGVVAIFLAYETRNLLIGESMDADEVKRISRLLQEDPAVLRVESPLTMHFGPRNVLLNAVVYFRTDINSEELAGAFDRMERAVQKEYPEVKRIFMDARTETVGRAEGR